MATFDFKTATPVTSGLTDSNYFFGAASQAAATPLIYQNVALRTYLLGTATSALSISAGKTLTITQSLTFSGTDSTTMTLPATSTTLAGVSIAQTFTADQALGSTNTLGWSTDLFLARDAANVLAVRNGTNAQTLRIYNTYSGAGANYERGVFSWVGNEFFIGTSNSGTGVARNMILAASGTAVITLQNNNTARWQVTGGGNFIAFADNTYDIGASGATRPRSVFAATSVVTPLVSVSASTTYTVAAAGPILKQGANGRVGTFVATGITPVVVSNTTVAVTDAIVISLNTVGGVIVTAPTVMTITAGVGFTVAAGSTDTSTYNYAIIKNAA